MQRLLLCAGIAAALAGCKANPYCLNCGQSGSTTGGGGGDMLAVDLAGPADLATVDLTGTGGDGGCVPTNGGVEICDGVDNDCNGIVDDVASSKLQNDPNNCGACGTACNYAATHQFGACTSGTCKPSGCVPGYTDADKNPANGCELQCTPTNPPTEICDGVDNNCDGRIDEGFTATWNAAGKPNYDSDKNNCGGCGFACNLPGAVNKCGASASGRGTCEVDHCINTPGVETFRHDTNKGDINQTGCEYKCPTASSTAGDCDAPGGGGCTFPAEVCNGKDDDCNFAVDDNPTDPDLNMPCGDKCPGGLVANCVGVCAAGTRLCVNGVKLCSGGQGPDVSGEICDGKDNNCDGQVDEPFTSPSPFGFLNGDPTKPLYNSDVNNCGGCTTAGPPAYNGVCNLAHATNGCHSATANAQGNCFVVTCNSGFNYVTKTDSNKSNPTCDTTTTTPRDSTPGNVASGAGCFYSCGAGFSPPLTSCSGCTPAPTEAVCDGKDNNCDGCIDNIPGGSAPSGICSTQGLCGTKTIPVKCSGPSGWKCDYAGAGIANLDLSGTDLAASETHCDGLDNNCNGYCDENFPSVATAGPSQCAKNPNRAATSCSAGSGVCQKSGSFCCGGTDGSCTVPPTGPFSGSSSTTVVCSVAADLTKATAETCDGKDNNCNGLVDDPNTANGKAGYKEPTVSVSVAAGDPSLFGNAAAHTVFMYTTEAVRPDSTSSSPGGLTARSCSQSGRIPWGNVTWDQARQACGAFGGRLCTEFEWQKACEGPNPSPSPDWSYTSSPNVYQTGVCNDVNRTGTPAVWTTAHGPNSGTVNCSTTWPSGGISDLSGNLIEWTNTPVVFSSLIGGATATVSSSGTLGQMKVTGLVGLSTNSIVPGYIMKLSGANTAANNGSFQIIKILDDASAVVLRSGFPATGGTDSKNGSITWEVDNTYYRIRGGSYSSPKGGTTCEFSFDIANPGFANADVGFRCCYDKQPCGQNSDCPGGGTCTNGLCP